MWRNKVLAVVGLSGALAASGFGGDVAAQTSLLIGGRRANFGVHTLTGGFTPDPKVIPVVSGGGVDARGLGLGPGCVGFVTRQPDAIVQLRSQSANLRIYAVAQDATDLTLLVNTAAGSWRCNDDSFGGTNPTVDLGTAQPGQYDIWVGSYRAGNAATCSLEISEIRR